MRYTDYPEIKAFHDTLGNCSTDDEHEERMSTSALQVINFDKVKTAYLNQRGFSEEKARSIDALVNGSDKITYLIEFKNGNVKNENKNIQIKLRDSILMICDICHCSISNTRDNLAFVLVYNEERANLDVLTKRAINTANLSGKAASFLQLDRVEGFIVKRVFVLTKETFETKMLPRLKGI